MNTLLKKMMVALLAVGIGQAAWADDVPNLKQIVQKAEAGEEDAQVALGSRYFIGVGVRQSAMVSQGSRTGTGRSPI